MNYVKILLSAYFPLYVALYLKSLATFVLLKGLEQDFLLICETGFFEVCKLYFGCCLSIDT